MEADVATVRPIATAASAEPRICFNDTVLDLLAYEDVTHAIMTVNSFGHPDPSADLSQMVHAGQNEWLFLIHGTNDVLKQYEEDFFPKSLILGWRHLLEERVRLCKKHKARYIHTVVPEKVAVYNHQFNGLTISVGNSPAARLRRSLWFSSARRSYVDLLAPFRAQRDKHQLYLKTDTHWSVAGCHLAYLKICRRMNAKPYPELLDLSIREKGQVTGDLGSKFVPPRSEVVEGWSYTRTAERILANNLLRHFEAQGHTTWGGVGTHVVYENTRVGIDPRRIVIFGDSYTHHTWLPKVGALSAMMAETFREVHIVWSTAVDWSYVDTIRPDVVITEIAERFMVELPPISVHIEAVEKKAVQRKILS